MPPTDERDYFERIYKVVNHIPRGKVATYGDVAAIVGDGCDGRIVGHALGALGPRSVQVAWQRVIGRNGKITTSGLHQPDKLAAESVEFDERGYVVMSRCHWEGPSEEWVLANGFQMLPKGGATEDVPDNQLRLF
ncbi:MGMT family protein [Hyalangium versicolor]|uniref:MGMT family protein n=1 Tax=Hyalangium versicolor TaxID=2861190 RepID=UPI001CC96F10|nr:MGMT family protein [Hyalangium versicolor]